MRFCCSETIIAVLTLGYVGVFVEKQTGLESVTHTGATDGFETFDFDHFTDGLRLELSVGDQSVGIAEVSIYDSAEPCFPVVKVICSTSPEISVRLLRAFICIQV